MTNLGSGEEIQAQIDWLESLSHEHKVAIAGNHDRHLDRRSRETLAFEERQGVINWKSIWYLQHSAVALKFKGGRTLSMYGAPQTPTSKRDDYAFRYPQGSDAWSDTVPRDVDVLVTHGPPKYILDLPVAMGCEHLLNEVWRVQPTLHVFGHVHAGKTDFIGWLKGGRDLVRWDERQKCLERAVNRPDGFVRGLLDPRSWLDVVRLLFYGTTGLLWTRVWGGERAQSTIMINAALMYNCAGRLGNPPQVVEI